MDDLNRFLSRCRAFLDPEKMLKFPRQENRSHRRKRVSHIFDLLIKGYYSVLETDAVTFVRQLDDVQPVDRSIIIEGGFMALATQDLTKSATLQKVSELHACVPTLMPSMFQGVGGALSQLKLPVAMHPAEIDQFWGFLSLSGYGNYGGYFQWPHFIVNQEVPAGLDRMSQRAFDQGIGTSIWMVAAYEPRLIIDTISKFSDQRKADLWNGLGLAVGVWGLEDSKDMIRLLNAARKYRADFQSGVAFGLWGSILAGEVSDYSAGACSVICGAPQADIAEAINAHLSDLGGSPENTTAFLRWKASVTAMFKHT